MDCAERCVPYRVRLVSPRIRSSTNRRCQGMYLVATIGARHAEGKAGGCTRRPTACDRSAMVRREVGGDRAGDSRGRLSEGQDARRWGVGFATVLHLVEPRGRSLMRRRPLHRADPRVTCDPETDALNMGVHAGWPKATSASPPRQARRPLTTAGSATPDRDPHASRHLRSVLGGGLHRRKGPPNSCWRAPGLRPRSAVPPR